MSGEQPDEDLVISPEGPPLQSVRPDREVLTGWRYDVEGEPIPVWVTVQVRRDAGGWVSGPSWP
jgi:hypothetical protein